MAKNSKDKTIVVLTVSFKFPMTEHEAFEVLKNKNGKVAKQFRKYLNGVLEATAKKCLAEAKITREREAMEEVMEEKPEEKDCKE
ncbi:MAG: hypothetical protein NC218_08445 [Acetobacter sp.]|nr:hypothetical protein [Acetobacter sp.]